MGSITVYNKGKRSWTPKNVQGLEKDLEPGESAEMEEALGRRFVMAYPRDISTTGIPAVSTSDIERREQSVKDREANLEKWETSLKEREAKLKAPLTDKLVDAEEFLNGKPRPIGAIVSDIMPYLSEEAQVYLSEDDAAWKEGKVPDFTIEEATEDLDNMSKKQIVEALKVLGVKFDQASSKDDLLALLKEKKAGAAQ